MPEIPEIRAHAERLTELAGGKVLARVEPLSFTAFKTASPAPNAAVGRALSEIGQRAKYLLARFAPPADGRADAAGSRPAAPAESLTFVVHLMQGGRLRVLEPGAKRPRRPRGGLVRFEFEGGLGLMLTEPGTQHRAGVWMVAGPTDAVLGSEPLAELGPEATDVDASTMAELMATHSMRLHNFLRDQRITSGMGRRLANEICHRARLSPFASTGRMTADAVEEVVAAIDAVVAESLEFERGRSEMTRSADRPSAVHNRTGEPCSTCGDVVRAVEYRNYTVNYCAGCQTGGKVLADNTTSKFVR